MIIQQKFMFSSKSGKKLNISEIVGCGANIFSKIACQIRIVDSVEC
jgi:hypothetical protein